jgi:hypothetical protein
MVTVVTGTDDDAPEQAREFRSRGFVVLPGLLTGEPLHRARIAAERAVRHPGGIACERPGNTLVPLRWCDELTGLILAGHTRIGRAAGARDLRWISGYVSVKEPHSPPLWWHQDWWAWDHPVSYGQDPPQIAVLCYLSDTTAGTGALRVLPGSHAASVPMHRVLPEAHSDESAGLDPGNAAMTDQPDQVTLAVQAGDAVVTDYRLLHGTHANAGDHRRDCVLVSFTPNWSELPADLRGHLIRHPALPTGDEPRPATPLRTLLPSFDGARLDLPLSRNAPPIFTTSATYPAR